MPNGYFGVNSTARKVKNIYIGQNSTAHQVKKAYIGDENGVARLWYQSVTPISELPVGSIVKGIYGNEEFIIIHHGNPDTNIYKSNCTGTWIMSKNCIASKQYDSVRNSNFTSSNIATWLNNDFYNSLTIKDYIKTAVIPYYTYSTLKTLNNGYETKVFLLSAVEAGFYNARYDSSDTRIYDGDGAKLDYFDKTNDASSKRIATYNGSAVEWWMRTPRSASYSSQCVKPQTSGAYGRGLTTESHGIRPVMILPSDILVDSDGTVLQQTLYKYLRDYSVGQTVKIKVGSDNKETTWRIVHKGSPNTSMYDESCNGVWLMSDAIYDTSSMGKKEYPNSNVADIADNLIDDLSFSQPELLDYIKSVKIPYIHVTTDDDGSYSYIVKKGSDGLSCSVFVPSILELGGGFSALYKDGEKLNYFDGTASKRIKTLNGVPTEYWTRTANVNIDDTFHTVNSKGIFDYEYSNREYGVSLCFIAYEDTLVINDVVIGI